MTRTAFSLTAIGLMLCFFGNPFAFAQDQNPWTQFRGQTGTGKAPSDLAPPTQWDDASTVWETEIPGVGWSSPVYEENHIWITTAVTEPMSREEQERRLAGDEMAQIKQIAAKLTIHAICIEIDSGKLIHNIVLDETDQVNPINPMNSYASPTPAIADGKVVCHFGSYGTWCLDSKSGEKLWHRKYVVKHSVGPGSSPVIADGKVILVCDGMDLQFIAAVDLETGKEAWKTNRPPIRADNGEFRKAYCTPLVIDVNGSKQAVIPGAQWVVAYELDSGKEIWRADHGSGFSVTPMPVYESGLVIFSTGYMERKFVAVDPTGKGDVTNSHIAWTANNAPTMPSFIAQDSQIYAVTDKGIMMVLDAKTGKQIKRDRLGGNFSSSPILAAGNIYIGSREGKMTIVKCDPSLDVIATHKFSGSIMAMPLPYRNDLIVRTENKLIRIKGSSNP
ncbi:MAG: PQQ-binding-like beta-propeller repeat protein [Planctomycetota bacterium]